MKIDLLETPSEDIRLELIPLIDVIFCILTFFILAAVGLTRQQAIDLDLPSAQTGQPIPGQVGQGGISDRLYVSIDSLGQTYLDQQPVTLDLLYDVLLQFNQVSPNGLIVLYASRDARYEDVVTVLDVLRSVGGDRVALATIPRNVENNAEGETLNLFPDEEPEASPFAPSSPLSPEDALPFEDNTPFNGSPSDGDTVPGDPDSSFNSDGEVTPLTPEN
jgi:biopolymer transport protein ExbD